MTDQPISGKPRFDPVVTWGHVLIFCGFVLSGFSVYLATELRAADLSYRIAALEKIAGDAKESQRDFLMELKSLNRQLVDIKVIVGKPEYTRFPPVQP